jgi:hypothetical protein
VYIILYTCTTNNSSFHTHLIVHSIYIYHKLVIDGMSLKYLNDELEDTAIDYFFFVEPFIQNLYSGQFTKEHNSCPWEFQYSIWKLSASNPTVADLEGRTALFSFLHKLYTLIVGTSIFETQNWLKCFAISWMGPLRHCPVDLNRTKKGGQIIFCCLL